MLKQSKSFYLAVSFSILLHIALIVGVKFNPDITRFMHDKMPPLDIILINSQSLTPPEQADTLAQANSDKGGETAPQQQVTPSPKPSEKPNPAKTQAKLEQLSQKAEQAESTSRQKQSQVKNLESQAKKLMQQLKSPATVDNNPAPAPSTSEAAAPAPRKLNLNASDLIASNEEISKSEALIARQQEDYERRPRRKSVGIRTQEYKFAVYIEAWRQKVERIGTLNYPAAAREQRLYGSLQMTVYIKSDGSLEKIEIRRSSGSRVLDDAARRIVELSAPFPPFPDDIRKEVDILDITRTWTFTKEDSFNGGN